MFTTLGRSLDRELDELVPALLKKAGEVSTAGRENFLVAEADKALQAMCGSVSDARALAALVRTIPSWYNSIAFGAPPKAIGLSYFTKRFFYAC